ncbi:MAG: helix-turn-helix domain-containing protein [Parachlamydia sp.]|nr:helix-turn-helix domain-containing protein [Parachlamydia sp.]
MEEKNIYAKIRNIRQAKKLTVNSLAEKMGEDHQKVGRIERGKRSLTIDYLVKISKALDTPIEEFLSVNENKNSIDVSQSTNSLDILHDIIILVEENIKIFPNLLDAKSKGKFISKIYELTLKFPASQQLLFLTSFFEGMNSLK